MCYHRVTAAREGKSSEDNEANKQVTPNRGMFPAQPIQPTHQQTLIRFKLRFKPLIIVPDNLENIYQMMQLLFHWTFLRGVQMEIEEHNWNHW